MAFKKTVDQKRTKWTQFLIYVCLLAAGLSVYYRPPAVLEEIVGSGLVHWFGSFIVLGALAAAIAVFPGLWWFERVGLISLSTGMAMLFIMVEYMDAAPFSEWIAIAFILTFLQRWWAIKDSQLAPREE